MVNRRVAELTEDLVGRAFLHEDPGSYRAGVLDTAQALGELSGRVLFEPSNPDRRDPESCPECQIPFDHQDLEDPYCPWCGTRNPEAVQDLVWAEIRALEEAWPAALGASEPPAPPSPPGRR